jgi:hypothetical protein
MYLLMKTVTTNRAGNALGPRMHHPERTTT